MIDAVKLTTPGELFLNRKIIVAINGVLSVPLGGLCQPDVAQIGGPVEKEMLSA